MPDKTTIVINGRFLTQPITGVQRYAHEIVRALDDLIDRSAPEVEPFSFQIVAPRKDLIHELPLRHIDIRHAGNLRGHLWEQRDLPAAFEDGVLFCPGNTAPLSTLHSDQPVVVTVHDLSYLYFPDAYSFSFKALYKMLIPAAFRRADAVITVSYSEKAAMLRYYPRLSHKIHVIQNGGLGRRFMEAAPQAEPPADDEEPMLLYVGALNPRKNPQGILQAVSLLARRMKFRLVLAGGGSKSFQNKELAIPKGLSDRVELTGQINDTDQLIELYRNAACLVFPSFYEASPLPPIEAMACGCPVIASDIPALQERCGDAALYCDPHRPEDIADKIQQVLGSPEQAEALRRKGAQRARQYTWEFCAKETLQVITKVLNMKK